MRRFLRFAPLPPLVAASVLLSNPGGPFSAGQKAFYLDPKQVDFVRPGLLTKILSAQIAQDGAIQTRVRITDLRGLPLDREGVTTPGTVSLSFIAAYIPKGQVEYRAYTVRTQTSPVTGASAVQASADTGGTFQKVAEGEYIYTFATKAANFDPTATHSIGVYSSRSLAEFDLGTQFSDDVFTFVPNGSPVIQVHDEVRTATCNKCHDPLMAHGGARQKVELCVLCHTEQTSDPDTGNTVDLPVMVHKIHMGANLPSVKAGKPYRIIGFNPAGVDFSHVEFPAESPANCEFCHNSPAAQADAWLTRPSRKACGACHDDVNFATGENHHDLPQLNDNQCSNCHVPQGELEFDASIRGAHLLPRSSTQLPGIVFTLDRVDNGAAGSRPTVTFSVKDKSGNPLKPGDLDLLNLVMGFPTTDYATSFSEDVRQRAAAGPGAGVYTYTFQNPVPADARGSAGIGIEGYKNVTLQPNTVQAQTVRDVGQNKVIYFSVDGTAVKPRRTVVATQQCNQCHFRLALHGTIRNEVEHCQLCHNPNATDQARRPAAQNPPESIQFANMVHKIHTGEELEVPYIVYGFGGSVNDFGDILFPGDRRDCAKCHVGTSFTLPLQQGLLPVVNPRGFINPEGPATAACLGCHTSQAVASHALASTTTLGEACAACHGTGLEFAVERVHAR